MESVLAVVIRCGLGLIFGILFGIAGLFITFAVVPGFYTPPLWMLVFTTGIASGIAAFFAFLKPESRWRIIGLGLALALVGGVAGAWFGYFYGKVFYPEGVRNVTLAAGPSLKSPAVFAFITFASIFSTALGALYYGFRLWRYHEV